MVEGEGGMREAIRGGQKWRGKDAGEEKIIDGLERAKKAYDDKIENILQPIRTLAKKCVIVTDHTHQLECAFEAMNETLRRAGK